jgi:hypothetical protein
MIALDLESKNLVTTDFQSLEGFLYGSIGSKQPVFFDEYIALNCDVLKAELKVKGIHLQARLIFRVA